MTSWALIDFENGVVPLDKPHREVAPDHLEFVRTLPCCFCGKPPRSAPHHVETVGSRGSDFFAIPVCDGPGGCHDKCHSEEIKRPEQWKAVAHVLRRRFVGPLRWGEK